MRQGLAKFKLPERVEVIAEFPTTRVGKVDKQALRRAIAEMLANEQLDEHRQAGAMRL
jgi:non-ribosomal peptide synthetase component E (peptide arylation enzyme)